MKVRSKEQLIDLLDEDLSWRKKELTFLKNNINSKSGHYKTYLRCGILLLYAHWEGYVKKSCESYLSYVKYKNLKYNELTENFVALCIK